jgi:Bacterial PH domain
VVNLGLQASPRFAIVVSAILVTITGVAYACAFRARVVADEAGLTVLNPVREFRVPWSGVRQIDVRDWVRVHCATAPGADTTEMIECWALFATARVKRNYSDRAQSYAVRSAEAARMPDEAKRLMSLPTVVIIARQLEARAGAERDRGAPDGALRAAWAWPSIAAMALPALALVIVLLT